MSEQIKERNEAISIELCGHPMDDGRIYITSETLKGFHFIIEMEDVIGMESLGDALIPFLSAYLKVKIENVRPAMTPQAFRQRALKLPVHHARRIQFVADAVAA